jgi:hypothetical protein
VLRKRARNIPRPRLSDALSAAPFPDRSCRTLPQTESVLSLAHDPVASRGKGVSASRTIMRNTGKSLLPTPLEYFRYTDGNCCDALRRLAISGSPCCSIRGIVKDNRYVMLEAGIAYIGIILTNSQCGKHHAGVGFLLRSKQYIVVHGGVTVKYMKVSHGTEGLQDCAGRTWHPCPAAAPRLPLKHPGAARAVGTRRPGASNTDKREVVHATGYGAAYRVNFNRTGAAVQQLPHHLYVAI